MSLYIWIVASIGYLFALKNIVLLVSLKYKKMLDKTLAFTLLLAIVFWTTISSVGFGLVLTQ